MYKKVNVYNADAAAWETLLKWVPVKNKSNHKGETK